MDNIIFLHDGLNWPYTEKNN